MNDPAWLTAQEIGRGIRSGDLDAQAAPRQHGDRIARLNARAGAFVHVAPAAESAAAGPLAGVGLAV